MNSQSPNLLIGKHCYSLERGPLQQGLSLGADKTLTASAPTSSLSHFAQHNGCQLFIAIALSISWAFLVCEKTSFGKRWGSINDKTLLTVSHIFFLTKILHVTRNRRKTPLQRNPFQRADIWHMLISSNNYQLYVTYIYIYLYDSRDLNMRPFELILISKEHGQ